MHSSQNQDSFLLVLHSCMIRIKTFIGETLSLQENQSCSWLQSFLDKNTCILSLCLFRFYASLYYFPYAAGNNINYNLVIIDLFIIRFTISMLVSHRIRNRLCLPVSVKVGINHEFKHVLQNYYLQIKWKENFNCVYLKQQIYTKFSLYNSNKYLVEAKQGIC